MQKSRPCPLPCVSRPRSTFSWGSVGVARTATTRSPQCSRPSGCMTSSPPRCVPMTPSPSRPVVRMPMRFPTTGRTSRCEQPICCAAPGAIPISGWICTSTRRSRSPAVWQAVLPTQLARCSPARWPGGWTPLPRNCTTLPPSWGPTSPSASWVEWPWEPDVVSVSSRSPPPPPTPGSSPQLTRDFPPRRSSAGSTISGTSTRCAYPPHSSLLWPRRMPRTSRISWATTCNLLR